MATINLFELADEIGCSSVSTRDLLALAGGNAELVREASTKRTTVESMKAYIVDHRISKVEEKE